MFTAAPRQRNMTGFVDTRGHLSFAWQIRAHAQTNGGLKGIAHAPPASLIGLVRSGAGNSTNGKRRMFEQKRHLHPFERTCARVWRCSVRFIYQMHILQMAGRTLQILPFNVVKLNLALLRNCKRRPVRPQQIRDVVRFPLDLPPSVSLGNTTNVFLIIYVSGAIVDMNPPPASSLHSWT